ncbi:MAG: sortase [Bacilli bacterium]|nr:sortase [Bacilli bacterium]
MLNKIFSLIICAFILILSCLEGYNIIDTKNIKNKNEDNIIAYYQENKSFEEKENHYEYLGILNIKDIKLNRGFYSKESPLNDLSKNIYYLKESIPLEEKNSMIILAAHRGTSKISFFNNLDKLKIGSEIELNYKGENYKYILSFKYNELKDGRLSIYRDKNKDSLILITCNKFDKKRQTIYVSYRREEVK